ncbi:MAG: 5-oxoprolinase subunit PxpB, partial [Candidatus Nanopelagicales bacterium]
MTSVVHPMGARAVLIETADPLGVARAIAASVERGHLPGVIDLVPAATTVLVRFDSPLNVDMPALAALPPQAASGPVEQQVVTIPVLYGGADLPEVAEESGMAPEELIALHAAAEYTVDFCGFAPGFGYLSGVPERLHVPRLASPRPRVPAGSVALAAGYTAVYPTESPGGWRLIGRTNLTMFDPHREPAALLSPGIR